MRTASTDWRLLTAAEGAGVDVGRGDGAVGLGAGAGAVTLGLGAVADGFVVICPTAKDLMLAETVLRSSETSFNITRISSILSTS